ncbi:MAG TPA: tRNA (adenosine(37)-N6)-threonylcarbamoyltransferase complex ATPase subunit type 1 TsaE [Verrucomicrobiae bacterium]|nr:tRNA (adenosine(37)-N6)-threonylcarbamoyltransferase complex ATPase subunit type 1 TsaE [Verrucomicrobiae bacterium]
MSSVTTWEIDSHSSAQTEELASKVGRNLRGSEVIELVSDLGGGKTTFTRGLVRGAGSDERVRSPTFTLSSEYKTSKFTIAHFDFYRLGEAGIVADELAEVVGDTQYVVVVEWGEIVHDVLPADRLTIHFLRTGDELRKITFEYPNSLAYLLKGLE